MRPIDSPGLWHLPDNERGNVAGTLRYSHQAGILLSLTGTLRDGLSSPVPDTYPIIHGVISQSPYDGKLVTLVDCFRKRAAWVIPGFASEEIRANRAYVGTRYLSSEEDARFVSFRATYSHLPEWSGLTGFRQRVRQDNAPGVIAVPYDRPAPLELCATDTRSVRVEVSVATDQGLRRVTIRERVELRGSDAAGFAPLVLLRTLVSPFQDLLTFAVDTPSTLNDITFTTEPTGGRPVGDSVNLVFQPVYHRPDDHATLVPSDMLFRWADIEASHPDVLPAWLRFRNDFKAPCDIHFGLAYGPPAYIETKFLLLVTSLSLFLAGSVPDQEIRDAIESLRRAAPSPHKKLWIDMIPSAEELSLPQTVSALIEEYRELLLPAVQNNSNDFLVELVDVKAQLFRLQEASRTSRDMQIRLLQMIERLNLLTKVQILRSLGFSRTEIVALVSDNRRYRNLARRDNGDLG